jgi:hypothetical protein
MQIGNTDLGSEALALFAIAPSISDVAEISELA